MVTCKKVSHNKYIKGRLKSTCKSWQSDQSVPSLHKTVQFYDLKSENWQFLQCTPCQFERLLYRHFLTLFRLDALFWRHMQNSDIAECHHFLLTEISIQNTCIAELQTRGGIEDNSKIIFLISQWIHMLWPLINDGSQNMFFWRNVANYPLIISVTPSYLEHCNSKRANIHKKSLKQEMDTPKI